MLLLISPLPPKLFPDGRRLSGGARVVHLGGMKGPEERRRYWSTLIARYEGSGLSQAKFAVEAGVGEAIFRYWLYKTRRERTALVERPRVADDVRLMPVQIRRPSGQLRIEVRVADVRVLAPVGTDPAYLADVLIALKRSAAC